MMKTCPICRASCFEDMEICFGCMHRFESEGEDGRSRPKLEIPTIEASPVEGAVADRNDSCLTREAASEGPRHAAAPTGFDQVVKIPIVEQAPIPLAGGYQLVISLQPVPVG